MKIASPQFFITAVAMFAVAAIVTGICVIDSPQQVRAHKIDAKRITELQAIVARIKNYYHVQNRLPERLDQSDISYGSFKDPVTGHPYEYNIIDADNYELCAMFDTVLIADRQTSNCWVFQQHGRGRYCFRIAIKSCV